MRAGLLLWPAEGLGERFVREQELFNRLRNVVTQCRKMLEDDTRDALEGKFGIFAKKDQVTDDRNAKMTHLSAEEQAARKDIDGDVVPTGSSLVFRNTRNGSTITTNRMVSCTICMSWVEKAAC
jgi:hypothetical protein